MKTTTHTFIVAWVITALLLVHSLASGAVLNAPTGLAKVVGNGEISLVWEPVSGATGYIVYRGEASAGPFTFVAQPRGSGFTDRNVSNGSAYYYVVTALNADGQSAFSPPLEATPTTSVLRAPGSVAAIAGNGRISLTWSPVTSAAAYNVYRASASGGPYILLTTPALGPSYTDRDPANGTTYFYVVQTCKASSCIAGSVGAYSEEMRATPSSKLPSAPSGLTAIPGSTWVSLAWDPLEGLTALNEGSPLNAPSYVVSDGAFLYVVTDNGARIQSLPMEGGAATVLYTTSGALALTVLDNDLFWIDPNSGPSTDTQIWKAPKDGSGAPTVIYTESATGSGWLDNDVIDGTGICNDGTRLYAADEVQGRVVAFNQDGSGMVRLDAGRYTGGFDTERLNTIAYADNGLYIADSGREGVASPGVYFLPAAGGAFATLHSGAPLVTPVDIAVAADFLYIADSGINTIWKLPRSGGTPTALLPAGTFVQIGGITLAGDILYASDRITGLIHRIDTITTANGVSGYAVYRGNAKGGPYQFVGLSETTRFEEMGLTNGITYYYVVAGVNADGRGAFSNEASALVSAIERPHTPALNAVWGNSGAVWLSWDSPPGAVSYKLYRSQTPDDGNPTLLTTTTEHGYDDTGLTDGATYYYTVDALNAASPPLTARSNVVAATPVALLSAPGGLRVTPGNTQATVTWNPVAGASSYYVTVATSSGGEWTAASGQTASAHFTLQSLTNGQPYYIRIQAGGGNWSGYSGEVVVTPEDTRPLAPANISATVGNRQVSVRWDAVPQATGYRIYRRASNSAWPVEPIGTATGTLFTDTGLANGIQYDYLVSAVNDTGEGASSPSYASAVPSTACLTRPVNVRVIPGTTEATVIWDPVVDATSYYVTVSTSSGGAWEPSSGQVSCTHFTAENLTNGQTYYFRVQAGGANWSAFSEEVSATPAYERPQAPTNLTIDLGNTQTSIRWSAVDGASDYQVFRRISGDPWPSEPIAVVTGTLFTDTGLINGTVYDYAVAAVNDIGAEASVGAWSTVQVSLSPTVTMTDAPVNVKVVPGNTQATATWDPVPGATLYGLTVTATPGGTALDWGSTTGCHYTVENLANGQTYYFRVQAAGGDFWSACSDEISATPTEALPPAPTGLYFVPGNSRISLLWNAMDGVTSYAIYRRTAADPWPVEPTATTTGTLFNDAGLVNGIAYFYAVTAVNEAGPGAWSLNEPSSTPVDTAPAAPVKVTVVPGNTQATVTWDPVPGAIQYGLTVAATPGGNALDWGSTTGVHYTIGNLVNGQTYYFRIQAGGDVWSAYSDEVSTIPNPDAHIGNLSGRIATNLAGHAGLGVANATVSLQGTAYSAQTDANGDFIMLNVPYGNYTLVVTAANMETRMETISLNSASLAVAVADLALPTCPACVRGDANNDQRVGLEDVIYDLQVTSGIRPAETP